MRSFLCLALLLIVTGCANNRPVADEGARRVLGYYAANVLANPTRIEGWNFAAPSGVSYADPLVRPLDISIAQELRNILFDDRTFERPGRGAFRRSVGFRVYSGTDSVEVLLSLSSDDIIIKTQGDTTQPTSVSAGVTNARDQLASLAKRAFPDYPAGR